MDEYHVDQSTVFSEFLQAGRTGWLCHINVLSIAVIEYAGHLPVNVNNLTVVLGL